MEPSSSTPVCREMLQTPRHPLLANAVAVRLAIFIARGQHTVDTACRAALDARARVDDPTARGGAQGTPIGAADGGHDTTLVRDG